MRIAKLFPLSSALLAIVGCLHANADNFIVVTPADAQPPVEVPFSLESQIKIQKESFAVVTESDSIGFKYADVDRISFKTGVATSVANVGTSLQTYSLAQNPVADKLIVNGHTSDTSVTLTVTALNGATVVKINDWKGESINVATLPSGLYILTIQNQTIKFIKK